MDRSVLFLCFVLCLRNTTGENFNLLLLLPSTDSPTWKFAFGTEMSGAAALIAIDEVNQLGLYGGHSLKADYVNTRCNPVVGLGGAVDGIMEKNYTCFIGPPCSGVCANVATLAAYRNIPVFNGVCQAIEMLDKKKFKTLTRLLGTFDLVGEATVSLIRHHKWKRIAIIAQLHNDRIWRLVRDGVEFVAKKNNIFVSSVTTIDERTQLGEIYDVKESLIKSKKVSRIIVVAVRGETFRQLMLHAYDLNMTNGDYVFIGINFYTQKRVYGDYHWKQNDSRDADAKDAYTSVFWVKYYEPNTARYSQFQADVQTRAAQVTGFQYLPNEKTPYQAANLYEAVWMYALALNATLSEGGDIYNGTLISQRLWGHSFPSMTGGVSFNKNGDRQQGYTILQTHQDGSKKEVGFYFARKGYFELSDSDDIQWRNGQVSAPSDSPKCGWNGEFCDNGDNDKREFRVLLGSLLALVFVILVACAVGIGVVYKRQKWQREVGDMKWKIQWDDIIVDKPTRQTSFSLISLGTFSSATRCNAAFRHIRSGIYNGLSVAIKKFKPIHTSLPQAALQHLKQLHDLSHKNTVKFIGACFDSPHCYILMEFCSKESLEEALYRFHWELPVLELLPFFNATCRSL